MFFSTIILTTPNKNKRLSSSERRSITIANDVKEVLIGILLGDGHIPQRSPTGNSRFNYAQTLPPHKEYFDHVFNIFSCFCVKSYIPRSKVIMDRRTTKPYTSVYFTTIQLPCFNEYKELFYVHNSKIAPINIYDLLTARGLAFWIMDDGSKQGSGLHISVYVFDASSVDRLMFTLQSKFNLTCSIHYNRDQKPRIYIFKESMDDLIHLVKPYFIKEMLYKLGL